MVEILGYDTSCYYNYNQFLNILKKKERSINIVNNKEQMKILNSLDKKIPLNAKYCYNILE